MCMISVIIPCYNSFKLMNKCLQALENQTFTDFEVIVIDDCSTDDSYNDLLLYAKTSNLNLSIIKTKENSGPGVARNYGIQNSVGKWLMFCDADDYYEYDMIEKMYDGVMKNNADICMCNYKKIYSRGKIENINYTSGLRQGDKAWYIANSKTSLWLLIINSKLFLNLKIPSLYNGEDIAVIPILLSRACKISHIDEFCYNYRMEENSLSNKKNASVAYSIIKAVEIINTNMKESHLSNELEFLNIKNILYGYTLNALKAKIPLREIKDICNSFELDYPLWYKNKYLHYLSIVKKGYYICVQHNFWRALKIYCKLHSFYNK